MEAHKERSRSNLKIKFLFLVLFLFANFSRLSAQQAQVATDLKRFDWLIGTWKRETSRGITVEKWTKVSDLTLEGESFTIQNGDTTFAEYLRLLQFGKEIFYTPKVAHNKYPVPFKLIKVDENGFTFEHSEHDFPQRIIYKQKKDGSLHARIEGTRNGKESWVDFYFRKVE